MFRTLLVVLGVAASSNASAELLYRATAGEQVVYVMCSVVRPAGAKWEPSVGLEQAFDAAGLLLKENPPETTEEERRQAAALAKLDQVILDEQPSRVLERRALAAGKRVLGLQTREEASAPFNAMDTMARKKLSALRHGTLEDMSKRIQKYWGRWISGNAVDAADEVEKTMLIYRLADPELPVRLFEQRRKWLQVISRYAGESPLVIVSPGHVLGRRGLLEGLGVAGFSVEQVKPVVEPEIP